MSGGVEGGGVVEVRGREGRGWWGSGHSGDGVRA